MKTEITQRQKTQFNRMLSVLKQIATGYMTPAQLRKSSRGDYGLDFDEAIEMSYDNIQNDAKYAIKGVRSLIDRAIPVIETK
jgi:hypothetical protein